jgi:hypothetical protein
MPEVAAEVEKDDRPKNISRFFPRNRMPTAFDEDAPTRCCLGDSQGPDLDIVDFVRHVGCGTAARPRSAENADATRMSHAFLPDKEAGDSGVKGVDKVRSLRANLRSDLA